MISLRSRKARLVGDWKLSNGKVDNTQNNTFSTEIYNGTTKVVTQDSNVNTSDYSMEITIAKCGCYSLTLIEKDVTTTNFFSYNTITTTTTTTKATGNWNFLSGVGNAKNKEYVYMSQTSSKQTHRVEVVTNIPGQNNTDNTDVSSMTSANSFGNTWQLVELKNKEIKFNTNTDNTNVSASGNQSISKSIGSFTLTAK
jgi:hypothetical protein